MGVVMKELTEKELYDAALTLAKHLEFNSLLSEVRALLTQYAPLEKVVLAGFSPSVSMMTIISVADRDGVRDIGGKLHVPGEAAKALSGMGAPVSMLKRASGSGAARLMIERGLLAGDSSLVLMRMIMGKSTIGLMFCTADPGREFDREHGKLFADLRPALSLAIGNCLQYRTILTRHQRLKEDVDFFAGLHSEPSGSEVVGAGMGLGRVMQEVRRFAALDDHVAIEGGLGSGRTFIARKVHGLSARQDRPFVEINCHQIPQGQMQEQLFGSDDPAVSQHQGLKKGLLLRANGGTVCLKGISRIPEDVQRMMSELISGKEIRYIEKKERIKCDVRFITIIDRESDCETLLFETLASAIIPIPALKDRREDIPRLAAYFIEQACRKINRSPDLELDKESLAACMSYEWPGNVRELENLIERGVLLAEGGSVELKELLPKMDAIPPTADADDTDFNLDRIISNHIVRALNHTGGKVGGADGAAELMGINPSTLRKRMRKLKIPFGRKTRYGR